MGRRPTKKLRGTRSYKRLSELDPFTGEKHEKEKKEINQLIARIAVREFGSSNVSALVLDSANLHTTTEFVKAGINPQRIIVPEINPRTYKLQRQVVRKMRLGLSAHNMIVAPLEEVVRHNQWYLGRSRRLTNIGLNCVFIDLLGTLIGSEIEGFYPLQDIYDLLNVHQTERIVLSVTCCTRDNRTPVHEIRKERFVKDLLRPTFRAAGYKIQKTYTAGIYAGDMWNGTFMLVRDPRINRDRAKFHKMNGRFIGFPSE